METEHWSLTHLELKRSWKVGLVRDLCQDRPHPLTRDCFHPVSNWGPFACEANVITTTLWKQITLALFPFVTEEILESGLNLKFVSRQTTALNKRLFPPSFELGTFRVLGERDNHYTMETRSEEHTSELQAHLHIVCRV